MVIVDKTDRLYRNFRDPATVEDLGVEIISPEKDSSSTKIPNRWES